MKLRFSAVRQSISHGISSSCATPQCLPAKRSKLKCFRCFPMHFHLGTVCTVAERLTLPKHWVARCCRLTFNEVRPPFGAKWHQRAPCACFLFGDKLRYKSISIAFASWKPSKDHSPTIFHCTSQALSGLALHVFHAKGLLFFPKALVSTSHPESQHIEPERHASRTTSLLQDQAPLLEATSITIPNENVLGFELFVALT